MGGAVASFAHNTLENPKREIWPTRRIFSNSGRIDYTLSLQYEHGSDSSAENHHAHLANEICADIRRLGVYASTQL